MDQNFAAIVCPAGLLANRHFFEGPGAARKAACNDCHGAKILSIKLWEHTVADIGVSSNIVIECYWVLLLYFYELLTW